MSILAFDTATRATTVALCREGHAPLELRDDPDRGSRGRHASRLLPLVAEALERSGSGWQDVELVAVGIGPGTFTGLRIGVATARALAISRGIPLAGVSTLHSLALNRLETPAVRAEVVAAVLDARRGEVFSAAWSRDPWTRLLEPAALAPEALCDALARFDLPVIALGEGAVEFRDLLERTGAFIPEDESTLHRVTAANHCRLAPSTGPSEPDGVHPLYLRLPDAELARRQ